MNAEIERENTALASVPLLYYCFITAIPQLCGRFCVNAVRKQEQNLNAWVQTIQFLEWRFFRSLFFQFGPNFHWRVSWSEYMASISQANWQNFFIFGDHVVLYNCNLFCLDFWLGVSRRFWWSSSHEENEKSKSHSSTFFVAFSTVSSPSGVHQNIKIIPDVLAADSFYPACL